MSFADGTLHQIRTAQALLMDLHDPQGIYFHRAWNTCLATFIAALMLSLASEVVQPLLVIAALCFMLTTNPRDRRVIPTTLAGSLIIVLVSTSLLIVTQFQPILQATILISLGFLVHYLPQFGAAFSGGLFVWILCLLASAGNPHLNQLPETLVNIAIGWIIVYLCYFWISPYKPHPILLSVLKRTQLRLSTRLQQAVNCGNQPSCTRHSPDVMQHDEFDRRIVSLLMAQTELLKKVERQKHLAKHENTHYRRIIAAHEELFDAILVLEYSLLVLTMTTSMPAQLQSWLNQLSQQTFDVLASSFPAKPLTYAEPITFPFEQGLQGYDSDRPLAELQRQNTLRAFKPY